MHETKEMTRIMMHSNRVLVLSFGLLLHIKSYSIKYPFNDTG